MAGRVADIVVRKHSNKQTVSGRARWQAIKQASAHVPRTKTQRDTETMTETNSRNQTTKHPNKQSNAPETRPLTDQPTNRPTNQTYFRAEGLTNKSTN